MQTCPTATNVATIFSLPCVKGGGTACRDGGIVFSLIFHENNPSVSSADSSPYTGEPPAAAGLLNGKSLFGTTCTVGGFREPKKRGELFSLKKVPRVPYKIILQNYPNTTDRLEG